MSDDTALRPSACPFCDIVEGKARAHAVYEDGDVVAVLDIGPIRRGHVQIIPRAHFAYFEDLPQEVANRILALGQRIAKVQKRLYAVERVAFLFSGGDIPHAHAHLVPMVEKTDITSRRYIKEDSVSFEPLPKADPQELERVAVELKDALQRP